MIAALIALIIGAIAVICLFPYGTLFNAFATLGGSAAIGEGLQGAASIGAAKAILQRILTVLAALFTGAIAALWHSIQTVCATPSPAPTPTPTKTPVKTACNSTPTALPAAHGRVPQATATAVCTAAPA